MPVRGGPKLTTSWRSSPPDLPAAAQVPAVRSDRAEAPSSPTAAPATPFSRPRQHPSRRLADRGPSARRRAAAVPSGDAVCSHEALRRCRSTGVATRTAVGASRSTPASLALVHRRAEARFAPSPGHAVPSGDMAQLHRPHLLHRGAGVAACSPRDVGPGTQAGSDAGSPPAGAGGIPSSSAAQPLGGALVVLDPPVQRRSAVRLGRGDRCAGCATSAARCPGISWAEARATPLQQAVEPSGGTGGTSGWPRRRRSAGAAVRSPRSAGRASSAACRPVRGGPKPVAHPALLAGGPEGDAVCRSGAPRCRSTSSAARQHSPSDVGPRRPRSRCVPCRSTVHAPGSGRRALRRRRWSLVRRGRPKAAPSRPNALRRRLHGSRRSSLRPGTSRSSSPTQVGSPDPSGDTAAARTVAGGGAEAPACDGGATAPVAHLGWVVVAVGSGPKPAATSRCPTEPSG